MQWLARLIIHNSPNVAGIGLLLTVVSRAKLRAARKRLTRTVHPFQPNGLLAGVGDIKERFLGGSRRTIDAVLGRLEVDIHRITGHPSVSGLP